MTQANNVAMKARVAAAVEFRVVVVGYGANTQDATDEALSYWRQYMDNYGRIFQRVSDGKPIKVAELGGQR